MVVFKFLSCRVSFNLGKVMWEIFVWRNIPIEQYEHVVSHATLSSNEPFCMKVFNWITIYLGNAR